jgi:putative membrane protein insertion efficiency factor
MIGRLFAILKTVWSWVAAALTACMVGGVRFYQIVIRPLLPPMCRFTPSCSEYFIGAVKKYGPIKGACKGVLRICRCHPGNPGGYDPP